MKKVVLWLIVVLYSVGCPSPVRHTPEPAPGETVKSAPPEPKGRKVTATAYTASPEETEGDPRLTACGHTLRSTDSVIAVSRDLEAAGFRCGTRVRIDHFGDRIFRVQDRTASRWRNRIDIFMGSDREKALSWGKRTVRIRRVVG